MNRICTPVFVSGLLLLAVSLHLLLAANVWGWTLSDGALSLVLWVGAAYGYGMSLWTYKGDWG